MSPLRAGVIGLGWAGQQHMAAYADLPEVELVGIAGMEAEPLAKLAGQYDVEVAVPTWQELIETAALDVVSIATPTSLHAPMAIGALNAGIHVLSEKPMAETAPVAATMVAAAKANDRVLDVSFNHRKRGDVQSLKTIIDAGVLGKIYYAKAGWLRREGIPGLGTWFTRAAASGGGPLMDIGVHMLDMALFLLGEPQVKAATAATYAEFGPRGKGGSPYGPQTDSGRTPSSTSRTCRRRSSGSPTAAPCCWSRAGPSGSRTTSATSRCTARTAGPVSSGAANPRSRTASCRSGPRSPASRPSSARRRRRTAITAAA